MRRRLAVVLGVGFALSACTGKFHVSEPDQWTLRTPGSSPRDVSIVYVHGIGCHEPGYSLPFQERLAWRMGLKRTQDETMQFYGLSKDDLDSPAEFATLKPAIQVVLPPSNTWIRNPAARTDAPSGKEHYEKRLREYRRSEPKPPNAQTQPFGRFSDTCLDRDGKSSDIGEPANAQLGPGVLVRHAEKEGMTVTFYEVLWSPVSEERKRANLQYDFLAGLSGRRGGNLTALADRALANAAIKDGVLNGGIPDAVFYAGEGKYPIRKIVRTAVCMATIGTGAKPTTTPAVAAANEGASCGERMRQLTAPQVRETIFFSESLGSRVLLDALSELATLGSGVGTFQEPPAIARLVTSPFFMFANQLPMFEIASDDYGLRDAQAWPQLFDSSLLEGKEMYGPDLLRACVSEAGTGYREIAETTGAVGGIRALRLSSSLAPSVAESLLRVGEQRERGLLDQLREASMCRRVNQYLSGAAKDDAFAAKGLLGMDRYERAMAAWVTNRLGEDLGKPGPIGLDFYLQRRALYEIRMQKNALQSGDASAIAALKERLKALTLTVYAFSDANDILTWEVSREFQSRFAMVDFRNVQRRVAKPLLPFRGRAGLFVEPAQAHLNYRYSDDALDVVMCILGEVDMAKKLACDQLQQSPS